MTVKSVLRIILVLCLTEAAAMAAPLEKQCQFKCGYTDIPYPFGIGEGCYANKNFEVTCNNSTNPPTAFLTTNKRPLRKVWLTGYFQVNNPIFSYDFSKNRSVYVTLRALSETPFEYSSIHNRFTAMGCDNYATLLCVNESVVRNESVVGGCLSICSGTKSSGCYGLNCCQASIPPGFKFFYAKMAYLPSNNGGDPITRRSVFLVDQDWFGQVSLDVVRKSNSVPVTLQWAKYMGSCAVMSTNSSRTYCSDEGFCWTELMQNVLCVCSPMSSYQEQDSYPTGIKRCDDMSKCIIPGRAYGCDLLCISTPEGRNCSCPDGFERSSGSSCYKRSDYGLLLSKKSRVKIIIIACGSGLGSLLLIFGTWLLYKIIKRRRAVKLKQIFFKRNGGLLLQQQLSANENNVEQTKVFDSKELEKATDYYHVDRILGQGGQGTVYKGMLTDGRIVAVKKSKVVDEGRLEEFINEVVILSQINHRNVVKLLGCCLETEVPLLVYEFIPNGTLFQHLHDPSEEFPITWEMRLRIAIEVARAVSYLHSAATVPIFHRDIKSTNILLDDKYRARVSDFGTSRSIAVDQTHLTTRVLGTFGYLDPEYFQSSQFTEKSDVYSFGVVLVELLTGQKPISVTRTEEGRSLATYFLLATEEDRLFEIVDARVLKEAKKEEIIAVAQLSRRCLNLNGKKRPKMRTVATELEAIRASNGASSAFQEEYEEIDCSAYELSGPPD